MDSKGLCVLCGLQASMMCQRCYECYCSVNCQISDWPKHKLICIPMPTLIPLQPIKAKKPSVNSRLDRSNFLNESNETNPLLISRNDDMISPLRRPYSSNSIDKCSDETNYSNQNVRKFDRNRNNNQSFNNRGGQGDGRIRDNFENNRSDQWERRSVDNDRNYRSEGSSNRNFSSPGYNSDYPGMRTSFDKADKSQNKVIDFTLKLKNKSSDELTPPVTPNGNNEKADDISSILQNTSLSLSSNSGKNKPTKKPWKSPFPFSEDTFFQVIVQYIAESNTSLLWVTEASLEDACNKLLKEINKNISPETRACSSMEINVGEVVAAPFEGVYYRALILEEKSPLNEVRIRLIDYGNDFYININQLKPPIPLMKNLNAYSFCIRYKSRKVEMGENLTIRITGKENNEIYTVEEKGKATEPTSPEDNIIKQLFQNTKITLLKNFQKKKVLVLSNEEALFAKLKKLNGILSGGDGQLLTFTSPPKEGDFVAGRIENSWERGYILACSKNKYVMYCADIGQVDIVNEIKMIPAEYKNMSTRAFILEINKPYISEESLTDKYLITGTLLCLKPNGQDLPLICDLYCGNEKLAEVSTNPWSGDYSEVGLKQWSCIPGAKDSVRITHVVNHCEIYICLSNKAKCYLSVFDEIGKSSQSTGAAVDKLVLAPFKNQYVRCKVIDKTDNEVSLVDIDSGITFKALCKEIKEADKFVNQAPIYTSKVTLLYLNKITPCPSNTAISMLQTYVKEGKQFILSFEKKESNIELFIDEDMKSSLNKQLIPLLFENESKNNDFTNGTKEKPAINGISKDFIQIEDIEIVPITTGEGIEILVLDDSMLKDGVITGCEFNPEVLKKQQELFGEPMAKYCTSSSIPQEYSPRVNEVCFSIFDADGQWYRAVCLQQLENKEYLLLFLDYGNTTIADKTKLRKISTEFLYPSLANTCIIDGLPQAMSEELISKLNSIIYTDGLLKIDRVEKIDDSYLIHIDEIKKIFP